MGFNRGADYVQSGDEHSPATRTAAGCWATFRGAGRAARLRRSEAGESRQHLTTPAVATGAGRHFTMRCRRLASGEDGQFALTSPAPNKPSP